MGFSADLDLGLSRRKVSGAGGGNLRVVGQSMKRHELGVSDDAPSRPLSRTSRAESMGSLADFSQHTSYQLPAELEHAHRHKQVSLLTPLQADASIKSCLQSSSNDLTNKAQHLNFSFAFAFKVLFYKYLFQHHDNYRARSERKHVGGGGMLSHSKSSLSSAPLLSSVSPSNMTSAHPQGWPYMVMLSQTCIMAPASNGFSLCCGMFQMNNETEPQQKCNYVYIQLNSR